MKYIVAVSGGIDSVVLLDMLARESSYELTVAHFDHGIRPDSAEEAEFVRLLADKYGVPFVAKREELGEGASEELARARRYEFLRAAASVRDATIVTAHHADDIIETVAINLLRGTGWRGLAAMSASDIKRPLARFYKHDIRRYALEHRLEWVEDSTNAEDNYLRNRVRRRIASGLPAEQKQAVLELWKKQRDLRKGIEQELARHAKQSGSSRYFLTQIEPDIANEILRRVIIDRGGQAPTRPQAERAILAVKTAQPGSRYQIGSGVTLRFATRDFIVETP